MGAADNSSHPPIGTLLREWRAARRMSQLDLALEAGMSARHLSCVETGKSQASRETVGRLANALGMPLREHNLLMLAAGFAPQFSETPLYTPQRPCARLWFRKRSKESVAPHGTAQQGKTALLTADCVQLVAHLPQGLLGTRDRALALVGYAGGLRRSELALDKPKGRGAGLVEVAEKTRDYVRAAKPGHPARLPQRLEGFLGLVPTAGTRGTPGRPATVALYLAALAEDHKPATLARRLTSIARAHEAARFQSRRASSSGSEVYRRRRHSEHTAIERRPGGARKEGGPPLRSPSSQLPGAGGKGVARAGKDTRRGPCSARSIATAASAPRASSRIR